MVIEKENNIFPIVQVSKDESSLIGVHATPLTFRKSEWTDAAIQKQIIELKNLDSNTQPIFMGLEALPFLMELKPSEFKRPVILIEPTESHFQKSCDAFNFDPNIFSHIIVVTGEWGRPSPLLYKPLEAVYSRQELGLLAFKLQKLQLPDFEKVHVFVPPHLDWHKEFNSQLVQVCHVWANATVFHQKEAEALLKEIPEGEPNHYLVICNGPSEHDYYKKLLFFLGDEAKIDFFHFPNQFNENDTDHFFSEIPVDRQVHSSESPSQWGYHNIKAFIEALKEHKPSALIQTNFGAFWRLEDILFSGAFTEKLKRPLISLFSDWFSHQSNRLRGGWSYELTMDQKPLDHYKIFSFYTFHTAIYGPKIPVYYFPYNYVDGQDSPKEPFLKEDDFDLDLLIVHQTRLYSLQWTE